MSGDGRLVRSLVACYPARWRRRYGEEYAQLLCDLHVHQRPALILNSLLGAVRAHGGVLMSSDSSTTAVVWAGGLFTVAGLGFVKLTEDFNGYAGGMYLLLVISAAMALLGLVSVAAPTALAMVRGAHRGVLRYVAVPFVGAAVWLGVLRLALAISAGHGVRDTPTVAGFVLIAVAGIAVVATTAWAVTEVLSRVPAAPSGPLRPVALMTVAAAMGVATVAAVMWGLQVRSADPAAFRGDHGILATPFVVNWVAVVVALTASSVMAALATRRRRAALR
jgi:hypothetical protein